MKNSSGSSSLKIELGARPREVFRRIVEGYLQNGEPVGSRNISQTLPMTLSAASVRNIMQDLENTGLIYSPHTSSGRLPTESGLRFFVDAMLEVGNVDEAERLRIENYISSASDFGQAKEPSFNQVLEKALGMLSGISGSASVITVKKATERLKHLEFVQLDSRQALLILVAEDNSLENRVVTLPPGLPSSALFEATNYLNAHIRGKTLDEIKDVLKKLQKEQYLKLDSLTQELVSQGLAKVFHDELGEKKLIVRGQANLLDNVKVEEDLERVRLLFADLEAKNDLVELLSRAEKADGVQIFIGSENKLFSLSGSSTIAATLRDRNNDVIGVLGVIGPQRLNYARIIPMVNYTAQAVARLFGKS